MSEDADQDGVDTLEALMLAVEAVILVTRAAGNTATLRRRQNWRAVWQMESALAAFRGESE